MHKVPETYNVYRRSVNSNLYLVHWETKDARFHVWIYARGELETDHSVYKNPLLNVKHSDPAHFDTRQMKLNTNAWSDVREWLLNIPTEEFDAADIQAGADKRAEIEKRRKKRIAADMETLEDLLKEYFPGVTVDDLRKMKQ